MLSDDKFIMNKKDIDKYLNLLAKEYRKQSGKNPLEIIMVGGAAIAVNYTFRDLTEDIDAYFTSQYTIKEIIRKIADENNIPEKWLNSDFKFTSSFSDKIVENSKFYKTFSNVVTVRTVSDEYLVAMKLMAGRDYKNDLSDISGILSEQYHSGSEISLDMIKIAVVKLYSSWDSIPSKSLEFIEDIMTNRNYLKSYQNIKENEQHTNSELESFKEKYPGVLNKDNLQEIAHNIATENRTLAKDEIIYPAIQPGIGR